MVNSLFIFFSGISLALGVGYLWLGLRGETKRVNVYFGLLALSAGIYYIDTAIQLPHGITLLFATSMFLFFPWYFGYEIGYINKKLLFAISALASLYYLDYLVGNIFAISTYPQVFSYSAYLLTSWYCIRSIQQLLKQKKTIIWPFAFTAIYFIVFSFEEIAFGLLNQNYFPWRDILKLYYLDFFPMIIVGMKLSILINDQLGKAKLEKSIMKYQDNISLILNQTKRLVLILTKDGAIQFTNPHFAFVTIDDSKAKNEKFAKTYLPKEYQEEFESTVLNNAEHSGNIVTGLNTKDGVVYVAWSFVKSTEELNAESEGEVYLFGSDISKQITNEKKLIEANANLESLKNKLIAENIQLKNSKNTHDHNGELIGSSPPFNYVLNRIEDVASSDISVLLEGETGVGKELFANEIHQKSKRKDKAFIKINCAAMPKELIESELFGHEKGAFTSADKQKKGLLELADNGTLLLDEIGDLPLSLQPKLLRVLQEGEIQRLGSEKTINVDIRVIAATNINLENAVEAGEFRSDLFYRINVFPISIPSLRQRQSDIPLLIDSFVEHFNLKYSKEITEIPSSLQDDLIHYQWPGNIRQLRNVIERAVLISSGSILRLADELPQLKIETNGSKVFSMENNLVTMEECERNHIQHVLEFCNWKISGEKGASEILNLPSSTLRSKMKKLGIATRKSSSVL